MSRFRPIVWVPTLESLGIQVTGMHALRHSAAARMIATGSAKAGQKTLGHRSAGFTLTVYGHFDNDWDELGAALYSFSRRTGAVQASLDVQDGHS